MVETIRTKRHEVLIAFLVEQRKRKGLRQAELARLLGVTQTWVTRMESSRRRIDVTELCTLAEVLGFPPSAVVRKMMRVEGELFKRR